MLSKKGWYDSEACADLADTVLNSGKRRNGEHKWFLNVLEPDNGKRPTRCLIRNDSHPQRSLRAGSPVRVEHAATPSDEHKWTLDYDWEVVKSVTAIDVPFRITIMLDVGLRYLNIVDGSVVLVEERPEECWELFDASDRRPPASEVCSVPSVRSMPSVESFLGIARAGTSDALVEVFEGTPDDVFSHDINCSRYMVPSQFLSVATQIGDEVEIAAHPATLTGVMEVLYGPSSPFRMRLCDGEQPEAPALRRQPGSTFIASGYAKLLAQIPVLGKRWYSEEIRLAMVRDDGIDKLLVQTAEKCAIGFPVGDIFTQKLQVFRQEPGGPVLLVTHGHAEGSHKDKALDGMLKKRETHFLVHLRDTLDKAEPDSLAGLRIDTPCPPIDEATGGDSSKPLSASSTLAAIRADTQEKPRLPSKLPGGLLGFLLLLALSYACFFAADAQQEPASGRKLPIGWLLAVALSYVLGFVDARTRPL